jgi:hypothetical protein
MLPGSLFHHVGEDGDRLHPTHGDTRTRRASSDQG